MKNLPLSYIEISKKNLINNVKQFRNIIGDPARNAFSIADAGGKTKISAVVKANAYGHGDIEVVKILNSYVDYFQVDSIEELERLRKITKKKLLI